MSKLNYLDILLIVILSLIIISIGLRKLKSNFIKNIDKCNLRDHGFMIIRDIIPPNMLIRLQTLAKTRNILKIKEIIHQDPFIIKKIQQQLDGNYVFQDYVFIIIKSKVHTCHRDYNGHFFNENQRNTSYTILFYLEDMDKSLDIIVSSHKHKYLYNLNLTDITKTVKIPKGSALLFDANLIHAGSFSQSPNNIRIQMKVTHIEDREILKYYENYNKVLDKTNSINNTIQQIQKHLTCQFPVFSDLNQTSSIMTTSSKKMGDNKPWIQRLFSLFFYGDKYYYDLSNAR